MLSTVPFSTCPLSSPSSFSLSVGGFSQKVFSLFLLPMGKRRGGEGENPPPPSGEREILSLLPPPPFPYLLLTLSRRRRRRSLFSSLSSFLKEMKQEGLVRPIGSRVSVQYRNRRRKGGGTFSHCTQTRRSSSCSCSSSSKARLSEVHSGPLPTLLLSCSFLFPFSPLLFSPRGYDF